MIEGVFCFHCGVAGQSSNAYCTRCGEWLPNAKSRSLCRAATPEQQVTSMIVLNGLSAVFGVASAIALYAVIFGFSTARWPLPMVAAFCICISVYQATNLVNALKVRKRLRHTRLRAELRSSLESGLGDEQSAATLFLPARDSRVRLETVRRASENTTELLAPRVVPTFPDHGEPKMN